MTGQSSQYRKALAHVESLLQALPSSPHARLPTITAMARSAGVAGATMAKAVASLRDEGRLIAKPGAGIYRAPLSPPAPSRSVSSPPLRARWRSAAAQIETDLLYGRLSETGPFPSAKELQARCGVSYRTLRKALEYLQERGVLTREGGRFRPAQSAATRTGTIVLVLRGNRSGRLAVLTPYTQDMVRSLEHECGRRSVTLAVVTCYYEGQSFLGSARLRQAIMATHGSSSLLGFVFLTMGLESQAGYIRDVLEMLAGFGAPVAVQADSANAVRIPRRGRRPLRSFALGDEADAGAAVGRYLLRLGHRHIAFLSTVHRNAWSRARLTGLHRSVESEPDASIFAATLDTYGPAVHTNILPRDMRDSLGSLLPAGIDPTGISEGEFDTVLAAARQVSRSYHMREALAPLAQSCLRRNEITAWVTANDEHALHCLDLLERRHVAVPQRISVVGFDDSLEALDRQLTSYSFDVRTLGRAMVDHVLGALPESVRRGDAAPVHIEGFLTVRRTSGSH
ncbi:MAG: GntR family transcriptional regulator [Chitinivibrionales bacterium]|nr:GntR family transcriptional regulator [Chitinivibrionales bacterium]